jgi:hypothetical protein
MIMKQSTLFLLFLFAASAAASQSRSYLDLKRNFAGQPEVRSIGVSGAICRLVVNIVSHEDQELADALDGVKHVRLMTIPLEEFERRGLSVRGFRSRLTQDNFELIANFKDSDSGVTLYHRPEKNDDRYFVLVEEDDELVAIEMKGFIDPAAFQDSYSGRSF